jgi:DNA (cytosine-5)-methyltransferase 1
LADDRGNLALEYLRLADRLRPRWLVWENVPGVLSSAGGRDFGSILGGLVELGYGFAYRVLDAQFFGVPQRRRRVFVVGYFGDWRPAAAVLFERHSLQGHPAPRREAREGIAEHLAKSLRGRSNASHREDSDTYVPVAGTLAAYAGRNQVEQTYIPVASHCLNAGGMGRQDYETETEDIFVREIDTGRTLDCTDADPSRKQGGTAVLTSAVRRLTPRECERLQGFPDDYTLVPYRGKPAADGPRYKALGNSMAVPVMRWIGERIEAVEDVLAPALLEAAE